MNALKIKLKIKLEPSGFTIVELLIATLVFALMIVVMTASILGITNDFFKGTTTADTQNTARNIVNDITEAVQYNAGGVLPVTTAADGTQGYCIGNDTLYSYLLGYEVNTNLSNANTSWTVLQSPHGLVESQNTQCSNPATTNLKAQTLTTTAGLASGSKELLSNNMRLLSFGITPVGTCGFSLGQSCLYKISIAVIAGNTAQLTPTPPPLPNSNTVCNLGNGSEFCAWEQLTTIVQKRVQ